MFRTKRLQNRITSGRFTLPAAILISVACWLLTAALLPGREVTEGSYPLWEAIGSSRLPAWSDRLFSFLLYGIIGYLLIELNNTFAIIRMRASGQTALYLLLVSVCPAIHRLYAGEAAAVAFLVALFFLFKSYQQARPASYLFNVFVFLGLGSLVFPQLVYFIPVFWIGAHSFQSLSPKSFFASLIGWIVPYWLLLASAYIGSQMELFYQPFREMAAFAPLGFRFQPWQMATIGYLLVVFLVSSVHCLVTGYEDKIRTRSYLNFLILLDICIFVYIGLQPALSVHLLPLLMIGVSILAGHLFVLTSSRLSNLFFICAVAGLFLLFAFNLWTLL